MPILFAVMGLGVGALAAHAAEAILAKRTLDRPFCPYCQASYQPWQWSATVAWVTGHWRCRECGKPMQWARLIAEVLLAAAWGVTVTRYGLTVRSMLAMLGMIPLAMVLVTDLERRLIPNAIMMPSILAMSVTGITFGPLVLGLDGWRWWHVPAGGLVGFLIFWGLAFLGVAVFGEGALGAGDVKLAAYAGFAVGFPLVIEALLLTFFLGGAGSLIFLMTQRGSLRSAIPYGPFLVLGTIITMIFGLDILYWYLQL